MNIEQAQNRIKWRFNNENVKLGESKIVINEIDQQAVNIILNWITQQKKETLKENLLFAKIFSYALYNEILYFKGDVKHSNRKLKQELEKPIEHHYNKIHDCLNMFELQNYMEQIGVNQTHPHFRNEEEEINDKEIFIKNNEEIVKKIFGTWTLENVYKSLNNTITDYIHNFKYRL
jgi:hypothetical protein